MTIKGIALLHTLEKSSARLSPRQMQTHVYLPQEDFLHGGDRGPEAGDAQLLLLLLQFSKKTFKPEKKDPE